jgi:hypothetical protein
MIAAKTPSLVRSRTTCSSTAPRAPLILCRADPDKAARDNRSTQLNPNNPNYGVSLDLGHLWGKGSTAAQLGGVLGPILCDRCEGLGEVFGVVQ